MVTVLQMSNSDKKSEISMVNGKFPEKLFSPSSTLPKFCRFEIARGIVPGDYCRDLDHVYGKKTNPIPIAIELETIGSKSPNLKWKTRIDGII